MTICIFGNTTILNSDKQDIVIVCIQYRAQWYSIGTCQLIPCVFLRFKYIQVGYEHSWLQAISENSPPTPTANNSKVLLCFISLQSSICFYHLFIRIFLRKLQVSSSLEDSGKSRLNGGGPEPSERPKDCALDFGHLWDCGEAVTNPSVGYRISHCHVWLWVCQAKLFCFTEVYRFTMKIEKQLDGFPLVMLPRNQSGVQWEDGLQ